MARKSKGKEAGRKPAREEVLKLGGDFRGGAFIWPTMASSQRVGSG